MLVPLFLLVILLISSTITTAFIPKVNGKRISQLNMMFGGNKSSKVVINVDGKTIECAGAVNLRKELIANKITELSIKDDKIEIDELDTILKYSKKNTYSMETIYALYILNGVVEYLHS